MQKLVYLCNSRDYTEQGDVNDNKYFRRVNNMLEQGWKIAHMEQTKVELEPSDKRDAKETIAVLILLEKPDDNPQSM